MSEAERPKEKDENLASVQAFISSLEQAYACEFVVSSAIQLTRSLKVSVVGRGDSCDEAIETLQMQFKAPDYTIVARVAEPNPFVDEEKELECMDSIECESNLPQQDTLLNP